MKVERPAVLFFTLALGVVSFSLLQSLIIPVLATIQYEVQADQATTSWVLTAYLLSAAIWTPLLGRLGDVHGKKGVLMFCLGALTIGSVIAAATDSVWWLIAARVVQGAGGGVVPLSLGLIRGGVERRQPAALTAISSITALGFGLGLVVAGPLVAHLGYRWLFLVPAVITSAAFLLTWACVPASTRGAPSPIPLVPAGLLSIGVLCLLLAISCGGTWGWSSARFLSVAIAGPLLIVLWMAWEVRTSRPFIDLAMLSYRPILAGNALTLLAGFCTFASFAFTPQFLQTSPAHGYGFGATVTQSGFILLPCAAASFLSGFFVGSLAQRLGFRPTMIAGALLMSSAFLGMVLWHQQAWQVIASTTAQGFSSGLILAACATLVVLSVPPGTSATASSINANLRTLGGAAGTAILAAILSSSARAGGVPSEFGYIVAYSVLAVAMLAAAGAAIAVPALFRPPQIRHG